MRTIPLTQGKTALVDDADYAAVSQFKWCAMKARRGLFYAGRTIRKPDGKRTTQTLHQFLLPGVPRIDHQDGDGLNNQRYNLRPATNQQNHQGVQQKKINATSRFRGASRSKNSLKWRASISPNGKTVNLGDFTSEEDAARAYDTAARKYFKNFAAPNFPL